MYLGKLYLTADSRAPERWSDCGGHYKPRCIEDTTPANHQPQQCFALRDSIPATLAKMAAMLLGGEW